MVNDMWDEVKTKPTKQELLSEIVYLLYRLQLLGEPEDRIRAYRDKIEQMLNEL